MSEVIPEAAVEAARAAVRAAMIEFGPDGHTDGDEEITRAALEAAAPIMLAEVRSTLIAHLEELGGEYDLQYSASIRKLAENVAADINGRATHGNH